MFKKISNYEITTIIACSLSLFNVLCYFSMRCIWTGIGKVLNNNQVIPNLLFIIFILVAITTFAFTILKKEKLPMYIMLGLSVVFLLAILYIIKEGAWDYLLFIGRELLDCFVLLIIVLVIIWCIFFYPTSLLVTKKYFKYGLFTGLTLGIIFVLLGIGVNKFVNLPVVYAVEDDYQIVFTSKLDSTAWIEINGKNYYDLYAGSSKSETKVHKVIVPMNELNNAKEYKVNIKAMFMRGPYGSFEGNVKTKEIKFKPINTEDGFDYYTISDVHGAISSGIKTASYLKDKLDLLIILGDVYSFLEKESDILKIGELAYGVTKGEVPVIYARGNHETKGTYADRLYKYVGSVNEKFYYSVDLGDVWAVVLDGGEDHDDDWWEYYGTSHFEGYRNEQTKMLEDLLVSKEYEGAKYKLALAHFPLTYVNSRKFLEEYKIKWTAYFNQMDIDMHLAGHEHELFPIIPGDYTPNEKLIYSNNKYTTKKSTNEGYYTDASFYAFIVSSRDDVQNIFKSQNQLGKKITGLVTSVDFNNNKIIVSYTNQKLEKLEIVNPFSSKEYGEKIELVLNND